MKLKHKLTLIAIATFTFTSLFLDSATNSQAIDSQIISQSSQKATTNHQKQISHPSKHPQNKQLNYPSTSWKLVGTWYAHEVEFDRAIKIYWHIRADGTYTSTFVKGYRKASQSGTWRYTDGVVYQNEASSNPSSGSISWVSDNELVLTIIDNGTPTYSGMKRTYRRI